MKTKRTLFGSLIVIGTLITLIGCGPARSPADASGSQESPAPAAAHGDSTDDATAQEEADSPFTAEGVLEIRMEVRGNRNVNDPVGAHIEPGTTVRFINAAGMHSATAYHPDNGRDSRIPPGAASWDTGLMSSRNQTFEVTLTEEGVYDYFCIPHETVGHVGRIVVGNPEAHPALPTDGLPQAAADALPSVEQIMTDGVVRP